MKQLFFLIIALNFVLSSYSTGQRDIQFHHLTVKDGLSNNNVETIFQDSKGFYWFGTRDGLNRFNGYDFEIYRHTATNKKTIGSSAVSFIFEDSHNNIWISSRSLSRYNYKKNDFIRYQYSPDDPESISGYSIRDILEDKENNLWFATENGVSIYNSTDDSFKKISYSHQNEGARIPLNANSLAQNNRHTLWIGTENDGLWKYNKQKKELELFIPPKSSGHQFTSKRITSLLFVNNGHLWVGTWDAGIFVIDTNHEKIISHFQSDNKPGCLSKNEITTIFQDSKNNIWAGTINGGVNLYLPEKGTFKIFQSEQLNPYSLNSNSVVDIYEDRQKNVWFGTHSGGVSYFNYNNLSFKHYTWIPENKNSPKKTKVTCFTEDEKNTIWMGSDGAGLSSYTPSLQTFKTFSNPALQCSNILSNVLQGNKLWTVGWNCGLNFFDIKNQTWGNSEVDKSMLTPNSKNIFADKQGRLWIATHSEKGIHIYDPTTLEIFNINNPGKYPPNLLSIPWSSSIFQDSQRRMWVGTYSGLFLFDNDSVYSYHYNPEDDSSPGSEYIYQIYEDNTNSIWVAGLNGLDLVDESHGDVSFIRGTQEYGLPQNIKTIIEDDYNNLWLGSDRNLIKFDKLNGKHKKIPILPGEPVEFVERASFKSHTGQLYFGTNDGFYCFYPEKILENKKVPEIFITDFSIFNKRQTIENNQCNMDTAVIGNSKFTVRYAQNMISFGFAALSFPFSQQNQYSYKLEGFNKNWIFAGTERKATYTNLPPGKYTFKVRASNSDGYWNNKGREVTLEVLPPFWMTNWFIAACVVAIISLLILIYKLKVASIERTNKKLKKLVEVKSRAAVNEKMSRHLQKENNLKLMLRQYELEKRTLFYEKELADRKNKEIRTDVTDMEIDVTRKNAELISIQMENTRKNELLDKYKSEFSQLLDERESKIKNHIKKFIKDINASISIEQGWANSEKLFNEIHNDFLTRLKHKYPILTSRDLRLCAYLRMNISSKEIASMLNITIKGIEKSRWRLRQKFDLKKDEHLNDFILNF
jgi:ligand-binding sensor domain-containing protein/DNA-binding CsgD family transcriptional regulator/gas vesicle protein